MEPEAALDKPAGDPAWRFRGFHTLPSTIEAQAAFLDVAGSLSGLSRHPGAADLHRVARWNGRGERPVIGFHDFGMKGFGGAVRLAGEETPRASLVGTAEFLKGSGLNLPEALEASTREWAAEGSPVLFAGWDGQVRAALRFSGSLP